MSNKDKFKEWYDYAKQLEYEHVLMKAELTQLQENLTTCEGIVNGLLEDRSNAWYKLNTIREFLRNAPVAPEFVADIIMEMLS